MAALANGVTYDRLHHFMGAGLWGHADELVGGGVVWRIIGDPALSKKGQAFGRRRAAVRQGVGQECELSDASQLGKLAPEERGEN